MNAIINQHLCIELKNFLAFECNKFQLMPPVYSREVYKLGFVGPRYMGNSYKMLNYKARKFFNPTVYSMEEQDCK